MGDGWWVMGDEYKNEEVYVSYHGLRRYWSRINDHRLRITDYASRDMSHMKHKTICIKLFCKQKHLLKIAYAIFFVSQKKYFFGNAFKTF
jgi:hypothetical protein